MEDTRNPNRRVKLEQVGGEVYLLLKNSGITALFNDIGPDWLDKCERACLIYHADVLDKMLKVMGSKNEAPFPLSLDKVGDDITMRDLCDKMRDAVSLALHGRLYKEQVSYLLEKMREGTENPPKSPAISSAASSATPIEPG